MLPNMISPIKPAEIAEGGLATSDNGRYVMHGVGAGALEGRDARLRCPPAPGMRCASFVGGREGVGTLHALVAERVFDARARYCHMAGRLSGLMSST